MNFNSRLRASSFANRYRNFHDKNYIPNWRQLQEGGKMSVCVCVCLWLSVLILRMSKPHQQRHTVVLPISKIWCVNERVCLCAKYHKLPTFCIIIGFRFHQNINFDRKIHLNWNVILSTCWRRFSCTHFLIFSKKSQLLSEEEMICRTHEHWKFWLVVWWIRCVSFVSKITYPICALLDVWLCGGERVRVCAHMLVCVCKCSNGDTLVFSFPLLNLFVDPRIPASYSRRRRTCACVHMRVHVRVSKNMLFLHVQHVSNTTTTTTVTT